MISRHVDLSEIEVKILSWLKKKMPVADNMTIANMERSGSGLSNESFLFDLSWDESGKHRSEGMVLRCAPKKYPVHPVYDIGMQFRIMQLLSGTNVPVPRGKGTRYKGVADKPDIAVTVSAEDWEAIHSGKMARIHAWTGGKLKVEGDEGVYRQLEDMISRLWRA